MKTKYLTIEFIEYNTINDLEPSLKELVEQAKASTKTSFSPYSEFKVGAAVLLDNKQIIVGSNQENAAYPSGLCAERVALFYANSSFPENKVEAIAIAAQNNGKFSNMPIPPCGGCRQVMIESENRFNYPFKVILYGEDKIILLNSASSLLPISFSENFLKKS